MNLDIYIEKNLDTYLYLKRPKFFGILEGYDLSIMNDSLAKHLIDKEVYIKRETHDFSDPDFSEMYQVDKEQYNAFGNELAIHPHYYWFNPLLLREVFLLIRKYVEGPNYISEDFVLELEYKTNAKLEKKSKNKYLKKQYRKYFPKDIGFGMFSTLVDDSEKVNGVHQAWYERFVDSFTMDYESFLGLYLTYSVGNLEFEEVFPSMLNEFIAFDEEFSEFINDWAKFFHSESILIEILHLIDKTNVEDRDLMVANKDESYSNVSSLDSIENEPKKNLSALEVAYYRFYMLEAKESFEKNVTNVKEAYENLGSRFSRDTKNIQMNYNSISSNKELRLKKNRWKKIENVIPFLTPNAKKIAEIELNLSKRNS